MKEFFARLALPSPSFFIKVKKFGIFLTSLSVLLLGLNSQFPGMNIPIFVNDLAGYCAVAGTIIIGVSKLTVSDPDELEKKIHENE